MTFIIIVSVSASLRLFCLWAPFRYPHDNDFWPVFFPRPPPGDKRLHARESKPSRQEASRASRQKEEPIWELSASSSSFLGTSFSLFLLPPQLLISHTTHIDCKSSEGVNCVAESVLWQLYKAHTKFSVPQLGDDEQVTAVGGSRDVNSHGWLVAHWGMVICLCFLPVIFPFDTFFFYLFDIFSLYVFCFNITFFGFRFGQVQLRNTEYELVMDIWNHALIE